MSDIDLNIRRSKMEYKPYIRSMQEALWKKLRVPTVVISVRVEERTNGKELVLDVWVFRHYLRWAIDRLRSTDWSSSLSMLGLL